jgi:hypothetical protein
VLPTSSTRQRVQNFALRDSDIIREIGKNAILSDDLKTKMERGVIISFSIFNSV